MALEQVWRSNVLIYNKLLGYLCNFPKFLQVMCYRSALFVSKNQGFGEK